MDLQPFRAKAEVLKVLGHPARLAIVHGLSQNCCNVTKIQECLGLPQPTISTHLRILRDAGIIVGDRQGAEICYKVVSKEALGIIATIVQDPCFDIKSP